MLSFPTTLVFYQQEKSYWLPVLTLWYTGAGSSSVYYWPGYYAFNEKPSYHNKIITPYGANITTGREAIDETFENYEKNPSLNFMVVYVDAPDETGHEHGVKSQEVRQFSLIL